MEQFMKYTLQHSFSRVPSGHFEFCYFKKNAQCAPSVHQQVWTQVSKNHSESMKRPTLYQKSKVGHFPSWTTIWNDLPYSLTHCDSHICTSFRKALKETHLIQQNFHCCSSNIFPPHKYCVYSLSCMCTYVCVCVDLSHWCMVGFAITHA